MPLVAPVDNAPSSTATDVRHWLTVNYGNAITKGGGNGSATVDRILDMYAAEMTAEGPWKTASQIYTESQCVSCQLRFSPLPLFGFRGLLLAIVHSIFVTCCLRPYHKTMQAQNNTEQKLTQHRAAPRRTHAAP
jgi:hypothetical protein